MNIVSKTQTTEAVAAENAVKTEAVETRPDAAAAQPAAQAETSTDSGSAEQEHEEEEQHADAGGDSEEEEGDESAKEEKADKVQLPKGVKRRIGKLSAEKRAAIAERDALRVQLEQLRAEKLKPADKPNAQAAADADGEPQADQFETHADYVRALTKWEVQQSEKVRRLEESKRSQTEALSKQEQRLKEGFTALREKHDDYEDVMQGIAEENVSIAVQQIFLEDENGAELAFQLAKNPKEWKRINALPASQAARELGKFEASLKKAPAPEAKRTTTTPPPIRTVGSGKTQVAKKTIWDAKDMTQAEYEALRAEQERESAQR